LSDWRSTAGDDRMKPQSPRHAFTDYANNTADTA